MADDKHIQIMELFGPTIQGEGIMTGTVTHFLRTGGCPLRCEWCDSLFAVLPDQIKKYRTLMTVPQIIEAIAALPWAPYVTFTGGDPAIQDRLADVIPALNARGQRVAVESQGMFFPSWFEACDVLTFSPKGPSSGNVVDWTDMVEFLIGLGRKRSLKVCIKVVVFNENDYQYALELFDAIPPPYYDAFYFTAGTPLGLDDPMERTLTVIHNEQQLADLMLNHSGGAMFNEKVHLGCQQHVLLWPTEDKGV